MTPEAEAAFRAWIAREARGPLSDYARAEIRRYLARP